jgi:DNA-binding CsgD family transcriptional regulator
MPAQSSGRQEKRAAKGGMAIESLANAVQALLENSARSDICSSFAQQGGDTEEILLDVELEGARYLLIRLPKSEERAQLSPREQEIVRMVAGGHPNKTIATVLNISSWTVCTYLRRIFAKLGVCSRAAMVARTSELGLIREHTPQALRYRASAPEPTPGYLSLEASNRPAIEPRIPPARSSPERRVQKGTRSN